MNAKTATIVAVVASVAALVSNIDDIWSFHSDRIAPYFAQKSYVHVTLNVQDSSQPLLVRFKDVDAKDSDPARDTIDPGQTIELPLAQERNFDVTWNGAGYVAGKQTVPTTTSKIELVLEPETGSGPGDLVVLKLTYKGTTDALPPGDVEPAKDIFATPTPNLVIASATPEYDRAKAVVGLFESGTPDCARRYIINAYGVHIGCEAAGLFNILRELDDKQKTVFFDQIADDDLIKRLERPNLSNPFDKEDVDKIAAAMKTLSRNLAFWASYDRFSKSFYDNATTIALDAGLTREREILLVYAYVVRMGPGRIGRVVRELGASAAYANADFPQKLKLLRERLDNALPTFMQDVSFIQSSGDLLEFGEVEINNVRWTLADFGVPDAPLDQTIVVQERVILPRTD